MPNEKKRTTMYFSEDSQQKLQEIVELDGLNPNLGKTEAVQRAIDFYYAFRTNQLSMDYLCGVYGQQMQSIVNLATDRIAGMLFKQAVELNVLTRMTAQDFDMSKDQYDKIRSKAVAEVKRSNGRVSMFETMQDIDA